MRLLHGAPVASVAAGVKRTIRRGVADMRNWLRLGACLIAAGLTFLAPGHATAQEPIRIGVLLPLTGPFAKNGIENWEAMQIARDMINERGGINGRKVEYLQGDATSPGRGDQRDRAPDHQGRHQDHHRLVRLAACHRGEPGRRASRRLPLGDDRRSRDHHPSRLQAHVSGRRAGAQIRPGRGRFRHRRSGEAAEKAGRRSAHRAAVGKPRIRQVGRRRRFAPTRKARRSSWSTTKATISSPPT